MVFRFYHNIFRMSNILVDQFEGVTVLMSRMAEGGGASTNMGRDELLLLSFDLKASRKQGCFL